MKEYHARMASFGRVEEDFMDALAGADEIVYGLFGIDDTERRYIDERLSSFPLNRLKPRYPWETVKPRPIKAYMADRFA